MFYDIYQAIGPWMDTQTLGSWASILAVLTSLYSILWIRKARLLIKGDRERLSRSLPEVHHNLQGVEQYLRTQPETQARAAALRKIYRSEVALENYLERIFRCNIVGANAFVRAARYYKRYGQVHLAISYYEKAISSLNLDSHSLPGGDKAVLDEDLSECFWELQSCYLAIWQIRAAIVVATRAERIGVNYYLSRPQIERPLNFFRCLSYTLRFLALDTAATVTRRRGRMRFLV